MSNHNGGGQKLAGQAEEIRRYWFKGYRVSLMQGKCQRSNMQQQVAMTLITAINTITYTLYFKFTKRINISNLITHAHKKRGRKRKEVMDILKSLIAMVFS